MLLIEGTPLRRALTTLPEVAAQVTDEDFALEAVNLVFERRALVTVKVWSAGGLKVMPERTAMRYRVGRAA